MPTFTVPSPSPTLSDESNTSSRSPATPPSGRNTFRVPSASPTPSPTLSSPAAQDWNRTPPSRDKNTSTFVPLIPGRFDDEDRGAGQRGKQPLRPAESPAPSAKRGRYDLRPARTDAERGRWDGTIPGLERREDTPAPKGRSYRHRPSEEEPHENVMRSGGGDGADDTDSDLSAQEQWQPLVPWPPARLPGKFSHALHHPLTLLKERPGRLPDLTLRSPTSPGLEWSDGAAWWYPAGSDGRGNIVREVFQASGVKRLRWEDVQATGELFWHENLVNMLDADGFGSGKEEVREEVLYEFCGGGTLNKLLLARRRETPSRETRRLATYLSMRDRVLGLPEDLVWHALLSLLRATERLHERPQPVVHGGIDPANVFFTCPDPEDERPLVRRYGKVKLGGFGRAVVLPCRADPVISDQDGEEVESRCAMFEDFIVEEYVETGYEAPELLGMLGEDEDLTDKCFPGPSSDVFSVGAVCFAMMTGKAFWDFLLEKRFLERAEEGEGRMEAAFLEEEWRFADHDERMGLLTPILRGTLVIADELPQLYSLELRRLVGYLMDLDPVIRPESAALIDESEEVFAEKCAEDDGTGLDKMRRVWEEAVARPADEESDG